MCDKKEFNWWEGANAKNTSGDKYRGRISVWACQSDTTHPKVLEMAIHAGFITNERYVELTKDLSERVNTTKGCNSHKPLLDAEELSAILEHYFGFYDGIYETEEVMMQVSRFGKRVTGEYRYMGEERLDKEWCDSGLASPEVKEKAKYGSLVTMDNTGSVSELCLSDIYKR